jgi:AcrR family transcriptional regulator
MPSDSSRIAEPDPASGGRPGLRADARHNRDRILDAAREAFATVGIDVPMAAIARRAGVGMATLYRRFPSRDDLVAEVFADRLEECARALDDALDDPDPWHGFCRLLEKVCAMQVAERGFTSAFLTAFPGAVDFERRRLRAEHGLAELVRRAKATGRLRPDFDLADLGLVLLANCGVQVDPPETAQAASRRLVAYLLQAFQSAPAPLPPAPPLTLERLIRPHAPARR